MKSIVGLHKDEKITLVVEKNLLYLYYKGLHKFKWQSRHFPFFYGNNSYSIDINIFDTKRIVLFIRDYPKSTISFDLQITYEEFFKTFEMI